MDIQVGKRRGTEIAVGIHDAAAVNEPERNGSTEAFFSKATVG